MPPVVLGALALGGATIAAGGVAAAFAATGLVGFAASFGASMLLSAAAQAMMPAPSLGQMEMKARTVTVREPVMPREMVYGQVRKGGVIVFLHATGQQDKDLHLVVVLAVVADARPRALPRSLRRGIPSRRRATDEQFDWPSRRRWSVAADPLSRRRAVQQRKRAARSARVPPPWADRVCPLPS